MSELYKRVSRLRNYYSPTNWVVGTEKDLAHLKQYFPRKILGKNLPLTEEDEIKVALLSMLGAMEVLPEVGRRSSCNKQNPPTIFYLD